MRLKVGDRVPSIQLPSIAGTVFDSTQLNGKPYMVSFFRFAGCPFCNMRLHALTKRFSELENDFTIIAIFDSPIDNLIRHATRHLPPFPVLADEENTYYKAFGVEHSWWGIIKGLVLRAPTWIAATFKGFIPRAVKGSITIMPAEFLISRSGRIEVAYYGKDEGDHLAFERIKDFAQGQSFP